MNEALRGTQQPAYVNRQTGRIAPDPEELLNPDPRFSLARLGTMLTNPFLEAEHPPVCPWVDVDRVDRPVDVPRSGTTSVGDLTHQFAAAVRRCIGDADSVGVMFSGGLDSTSVLVHAHDFCRETGRRLIAFTWDITDQFGIPTSDLVRPQLAALELDIDLVVIDPIWQALPEPAWNWQGPRLDYYSRLHRHMTDQAEARGCGVLLTGIGGDEVLAAWNAMTPDLIARHRWHDLAGYLKGFALGGTVLDFGVEALSVVQRALPRTAAFDLYASVAYREELQSVPTPLTASYRAAAHEAAKDWTQRRFATFFERHQSWAEASVYDAVYPMAFAAHPFGTTIPQASPFLDPVFVEYALGLPLADRFTYTAGPSYHWYKALHWRLLPAVFREVSPRYKQSYSHVFRDYQLDTAPTGPLLSVEYGLVEPVSVEEAFTRHVRLPSVLRNVENWIRGAVAHGGVPF